MKSKLYLDLTKSPYVYEYEDFKLTFSSESNMKKFKEKIDEYLMEQELYLKNRFSFIEIEFTDYFIIALYKKIEKRGFYVLYKQGIEMNDDICFICQFVGNHFRHFEEED